MADTAKLVERYGKSEQGNFYVMDTIGVPHPYCIGARHVEHAADHFGGMLGTAAIESAEKNGIKCQTCRGKLAFADHKQALLIGCNAPLKDGDTVSPELHAYLLKSKALCEEDGYEGFAFVDQKTNKKGASDGESSTKAD